MYPIDGVTVELLAYISTTFVLCCVVLCCVYSREQAGLTRIKDGRVPNKEKARLAVPEGKHMVLCKL